MRTFLIIVLILAVLVLARMSFYTVDATEYAYVTRLGQHVATLDGGSDGAGLHAGWPWPLQMVIRLDRRLQFFDLPGPELLTHDRKTIDMPLTVETYVCWRIAGPEAAARFIRRMGTSERARTILGQRINSQLGAAIGQKRMDDLISTKPGKAPGRTRVDENLETLQDRLRADLAKPVHEEYGIELVDIRLRRFNHPARVRDAIFERIKSERNKKVAEYQSEGEKQARKIETEAEETRRNLLARARFEEEKLKGQADTEAVRIRNEAHSKDPEFYTFLKKLEKLQNILGDNRSVLLMSSQRPLFDLLFHPPGPKAQGLQPLGLPPMKKGGGK